MDIRAALIREHSKEQALRIAAFIGGDPQRFAELMQLMLHGEYRLAQRAAWCVSHVADRFPSLINPYVGSMLERIQEPQLEAVKRNSLRVLTFIEVPEEWQGPLVDICLTILDNPKEPVAIRVHAMQNVWNICQQEPDLIPELKVIIEDHMVQGSAGFRSRGGKILRQMEKILKEQKKD